MRIGEFFNRHFGACLFAHTLIVVGLLGMVFTI